MNISRPFIERPVATTLLMIAILLAGFISSILFMLVNLGWKISVHTAFATSFVTLTVTGVWLGAIRSSRKS
jgi:hypothetical protein